jgi:hypothetical protein
VGFDDLKIRDLSRGTGAWTPPISAMGGPPAHQLYSDLVVFAGLQLYRDGRSRPWIVLRDGAQRHAFLAPSNELRSALDRFRMRRNLRPLTETTIDEFVRIVEARISDPDVAIPLLRSPISEPVTEAPAAAEVSPPEPKPASRFRELDQDIDSAIRDLELLEHRGGRADGPSDRAEGELPTDEDAPVLREPSPIDPTISGARALPAVQNPELERYVRVFGRLVQNGGWLGTTQDLSRLTREDPIKLYDSLLRLRSGLAERNILVANVEVEGTYRWLAVDRSRLREPATEPLSLGREIPAE